MSMPDGHVALDSGIIVKRDTASLGTLQDPPVRVHSPGIPKSERRGYDTFARTDKERAEKIEMARHRDPIISRGIQYYVMLSIGEGLTLAPSEPDSDEAKAVLDYAHSFWEANDFDDLQYVIATELTGQFNLFAYMPKPSAGKEFMPGVQLIPHGQIHRIATQDGKPVYYTRRWEEREYRAPNTSRHKAPTVKETKAITYEQDILAEEMVHFAMNRGAQDLRGVSMFESAIYWSTLYHRVLDTIWAYSVARSMFAHHMTVPGNADKVEKARRQIETDILIDREDSAGQRYKSIAVGQTLITGDALKINQLTPSTTAGTLDSEMRRILLMAATAIGLPEFALSDGNYSNLASSESQNVPFFRLLQAHQRMIIRAHRRILRKAFDWMRASGQMASMQPPEGKSHIVEWIDILARDVLSPNIWALAGALTSAVSAGWMSRQQAAQMAGLDWQDTVEQRVDEKSKGLETKPANPFGFPDLGSGAPPTPAQMAKMFMGYDGGRDETQGTASRVETAGQKAIREYAAALKEAGPDRERMLQAYVKYARILRDDLQTAVDSGRKLGLGAAA